MVKTMKISSLLNGSYYKFDDRKLEAQRKEMAKAYKRSSTFIEASKNPAINLIKDLLQSDKDSSTQLLNQDIQDQTEPNLIQAELEVASSSDFQNEEFEQHRFSHIQGLNINNNPLSEHVSNPYSINRIHLEDTKNNINHNLPKKSFTININQPEKLLSLERNGDITYDHFQNRYISNRFQKAISTYAFQMKMAETGFVAEHSNYTLTA